MMVAAPMYQVEGTLRNNLGDVLQGMVARDLLSGDATAVDREALASLPLEEAGLLIANGWYLHSFDSFPPPKGITPVYVSVHIAKASLLRDPAIRDHFRAHSPIGCRDRKTLRLFQCWGIPAYYSSCLTVTCSRRSTDGDVGAALLVDNVDHPAPVEVVHKLERLLGRPLTRLSHDPADKSGAFTEYCERAEDEVEQLLGRYCEASLVVTTKIHVALPCLGMGVPVILIHPNSSDPRLATFAEFKDVVPFSDLLKSDSMPQPRLRRRVLARRQRFLTRLVHDSEATGGNAVRTSRAFRYVALRLRSRVAARVVRILAVVALRMRIAPSGIRRALLDSDS